MPNKTRLSWPVLTRYERDRLLRVAMPIGGLGTGTISLGGRGNLQDFELVNRPAKAFTPANTFFILHARQAGKPSVTRILEGPIDPTHYEGGRGCMTPNHGFPHFRHARFLAAYPLAQVGLTDPAMPIAARLEAFNPLIPGDADASGIPVAVLRYVLTNKSTKPITATVCGSMQNFLGADGTNFGIDWSSLPHYVYVMLGNRNELRKASGMTGIRMTTTGTKPDAEQFGTLAIATTATTGVTHRTAWRPFNWGDAMLDFWDDLTADGKLDGFESSDQDAPTGSLAVTVKLPPRATRDVTFVLAWHFPNRKTWSPSPIDPAAPPKEDPNWLGNYYCTQYADAWDVMEKTIPRLRALEADTVGFVRSFCDADLPQPVKESALFNVSTLRSQTSFRTADGRFFGWEGCHDRVGSCHGSCTHVWNYEQTSGFLFGELALQARETEFVYATSDSGLMSFRIHLPLAKAQEWKFAAADGQMGTIMRLYRDWRLSGDMEWLRRVWPRVKLAMEFAWVPGGWDGDKDGVMEGCQHNTMDVEYFGPNPEMGSWYLGALRACEEMARRVGDNAFAVTCRGLFDRGSAWLDSHLFNGEYYEHEIRPIRDEKAIAPGLRHQMGAKNLDEPELQLGAGCLADQLVGQYAAHVCGLGHILDPAKVRKTYKSLMRFNFKKGFHDHFNHLRSYALGDESGLLLATYPRGRRPARPFPYANEVWTGIEYTAAAGMMYEGMNAEGVKLYEAARGRFDGHRRNPFDEAECGHHYARAMASWAGVLALTGFDYSATDGSMTFNASRKPAAWFWSNGRAWGTVHQRPGRKGIKVRLITQHGSLTLNRFALRNHGEVIWPKPQRLHTGEALNLTVPLKTP